MKAKFGTRGRPVDGSGPPGDDSDEEEEKWPQKFWKENGDKVSTWRI